MKTIVSALIALSVLAGIAAPASALDAKSFYEQWIVSPATNRPPLYFAKGPRARARGLSLCVAEAAARRSQSPAGW